MLCAKLYNFVEPVTLFFPTVFCVTGAGVDESGFEISLAGHVCTEDADGFGVFLYGEGDG